MFCRLFLSGLLVLPLFAAEDKLTPEQRITLIRGLTAEFATAKIALPRAKKALKYNADGTYEKADWAEAGREYGPAARVGDLVQVTKIQLDDDKIEMEINGGFKGGRKWYERIQIGMGTRTTPVAVGQNSNAPGGTSIELVFSKRLSSAVTVDQVKKILSPILDFELRTATESYVESLPPEIKEAVKEKRAVEGMDRDQVLLALGKPVRKVRETKDGMELEDWIYGQPPGKIVFVTFNGPKAIKVKETYAGLGTEMQPLPIPR